MGGFLYALSRQIFRPKSCVRETGLTYMLLILRVSTGARGRLACGPPLGPRRAGGPLFTFWVSPGKFFGVGNYSTTPGGRGGTLHGGLGVLWGERGAGDLGGALRMHDGDVLGTGAGGLGGPF